MVELAGRAEGHIAIYYFCGIIALMRRIIIVLKNYFVPHEHNEYKPHFFREMSILVVSLVVVLAFFGAVAHQVIILKTDLLAEVFPKVLVDLANNNRRITNLQALHPDPLLEEAARLKALDMSRRGYFAHTSPEGVSPWFWFRAAGYEFTYAGENLAIDFSDSIDVDRAWMASPGHRANILNNNFTEIGIATAKGVYEGRETTFVVQMFGRPAEKKVAVAETTPSRPIDDGTEEVSEVPMEVSAEPGTESSLEEVSSSQVLGTKRGDEMFVAVVNPDNVEPAPSIARQEPVGSLSTAVEALAVSPKRNLSIVYSVLAMIVALGLALMIFIKIQIQHPRNIAYGVGVIALMALLLFAYDSILTPTVSVLSAIGSL